MGWWLMGTVQVHEVEEGDVLTFVAIVMLHKQLRQAAELRITPEDVAYHVMHAEDGIEFGWDNGTVVLRHRGTKSDA